MFQKSYFAIFLIVVYLMLSTLFSGCTPNTSPNLIHEDEIVINIMDEFHAIDYVQAIDAEDGDITNKIKINLNNVNSEYVNIYKVEYTVTDSDDNNVISKMNVIVKDLEPPNITSDENIVLELFSDFIISDYIEVTDNLDGNITHKVIVEGNVNNEQIGTYLITIKVQDISGNFSTQNVEVKVEKNINENEKSAILVLNAILDKLKDPNSIQIHKLAVQKAVSPQSMGDTVLIDFSANNSYGGKNRTLYCVNLDPGNKSFKEDEYLTEVNEMFSKVIAPFIESQATKMDADKLLKYCLQ